MTDAVHGLDLVVVRRAVGGGGVGVGEDVADGGVRRRRLTAGRRAAHDVVTRDGRATVARGRRPVQDHLSAARGRRGERRGAGDRRWQRGLLVGDDRVTDAVHGLDLVVVRRAVGGGGVGVGEDVADGGVRRRRLTAGRRAAHDVVTRDGRATVARGRRPVQDHLSAARGRRGERRGAGDRRPCWGESGCQR